METSENPNWVFQCKAKNKEWIPRTRKISFVIAFVGFLFYLVSYLTPYWIAYKENDYTMNIGLFFGCIVVRGTIACSTSTVGGNLYDLLLAAQVLSSVALTTLFTAVCCGMMVFYWPNKYRRWILRIASVTSLISCVLILAVIGLYVGHYRHRLASLHFAFYFCIFGMGFTPFAAVMFRKDANINLADGDKQSGGSSEDDNGLGKKSERKKLIGSSKLDEGMKFVFGYENFFESTQKESNFVSARPPVATLDQSGSRVPSRNEYFRSRSNVSGTGKDLQPMFARGNKQRAPPIPSSIVVSEFSDSLNGNQDKTTKPRGASVSEIESASRTAQTKGKQIIRSTSADDVASRIHSPLPRPGSESSILSVNNVDVSNMRRSPSRMSNASNGSRQGNDWIEQSFTYNELKYPIKKIENDQW